MLLEADNPGCDLQAMLSSISHMQACQQLIQVMHVRRALCLTQAVLQTAAEET